MSFFQQSKLFLIEHLHLAKDALHIYVALIVFLGSAALFRWSIKSWKPWTLVFVVALLGESWDLIDSVRFDTPIDLMANWKDIWNTLFWPTVIFLLARYTKVLQR